MSAFSQTQSARLVKLMELSDILLKTGNAGAFVAENKDFLSCVLPSDFIALFDRVVLEGHTMDEIKVLTNKLLNIFHSGIRDYKRLEPPPGSFLELLEQNNRRMELLLDKIRPVFKAFVKDPDEASLRKELLSLFSELELFVQHYTIKENVMFPLLEEQWQDYRCVQIMWSFHDDIRRNIKFVLAQLAEDKLELKSFNKAVGDIFFNMLAIKFREERILFPHMLATLAEEHFESMSRTAAELTYPFVQPESLTAGVSDISPAENTNTKDRSAAASGAGKTSNSDQLSPAGNTPLSWEEPARLNLGTGSLSIEQIKLVFNHLPVDITYVDEHNKVRYFSAPKKRIFPRTTAVIGREVSNCHPPESVHVVEKIVESFKKGQQDRATFWIKMRGEMIYIQYFAVRGAEGEYKGVLEVSQEVSEIQSLEGEKRLLDW
ncbi:MAG: PAS domain-containing protein [Bacteroidales bacterium]|nr:PAS domain-containing protein [Bacteroidales bacterium]MDD3431043.1 PAS domain-containing protein [Bacteroidales bacterium]MDD4361430.1 PAS domain-containing protein [Bacteroidales bacterium]MDD4430285.1 PAS domain-containing protein [Bacteroidales bacterium]